MGKKSQNSEAPLLFTYGNRYNPATAGEAFVQLVDAAQQVSIKHTGDQFVVWDHATRVANLDSAWGYKDPYFKQFWLDNLVKWIGYNLWNHVYKLDKTKKAEQNADRAYKEYASAFV